MLSWLWESPVLSDHCPNIELLWCCRDWCGVTPCHNIAVSRSKWTEQPPCQCAQHCPQGRHHHLQLQLGHGAKVVPHQTARLLRYKSCSRDKVWAVKWYRGNFEIFRYIADEQPPTKVFKLDNFDVDVSILYYNYTLANCH